MNKAASKILKKILSDKKYTPNIQDILNDYIDNSEVWDDLKPVKNSKTNFIGIEIECFTTVTDAGLLGLLLHHDLENCISITDDGSIEPDFGRDIEIRCLFEEKKLKTELQKLSKFLKQGKFGVNDSCGLHVHLDMRNRDVDTCYNKLLKFQDVLFGLVAPERWENDYCFHNDKLNYDPNNRYVAINKNSYKKHKTIEIRLHHATLDTKRMEKWINLLVKMIKSAPPEKMASKADVLSWASKHKSIRNYVSKSFNLKWFEEKSKILASGESINEDYDGDSQW